MKSDSSVTVLSLFSPPTGSLMERLPQIEAVGNIPLLKRTFLEKARGLHWHDAFSTAEQKIGELLDIEITDILVRAWEKYGELKQYCDREKYPPEESILVPLGTHEIESIHHPSLEILVDDQLVGKMIFDLTLTLKIKGLILKIENARIKEIHTGECRGGGVLTFGGVVILEKQSTDIPLPGSISLGEGIALRGGP